MDWTGSFDARCRTHSVCKDPQALRFGERSGCPFGMIVRVDEGLGMRHEPEHPARWDRRSRQRARPSRWDLLDMPAPLPRADA